MSDNTNPEDTSIQKSQYGVVNILFSASSSYVVVYMNLPCNPPYKMDLRKEIQKEKDLLQRAEERLATLEAKNKSGKS